MPKASRSRKRNKKKPQPQEPVYKNHPDPDPDGPRFAQMFKQGGPTNSAGLDAQQVLDETELRGQWAKQEAAYRVPAESAETSCGTCRFFLRNHWGDEGMCQAVEGGIAWFASCDLFISALAEAEHAFAGMGDYASKAEADAQAFKPDLDATIVDEPWDGSAVRASMDVEQLQKSSLAFIGGEDTTKANYKLLYKDEDGNINAGAVRAIRAVLGGARGGVDIPEAIRPGVERAADQLAKALEEEMEKQHPGNRLALLAKSADIDWVSDDLRAYRANIVGVEMKKDAGEPQRLVYGVVLAPGEVDAHGDVVAPEDIEKACNYFNEHVRTMGDQHRILGIDAPIVQSYPAPASFTVTDITGAEQEITKGSWVLVTRCNEASTWDDIQAGRKTGYSFGGWGLRFPLSEVA